MPFFDFLKQLKNKKNSEENSSAKISDRFLVKGEDVYVPFGRPERHFEITDTAENNTFLLDIVYSEYDVSDLPKKYYNPDEDFCSVTVSVNKNKGADDFECSFSATLYQKDFEEIIGFSDVDLALYKKLKEARENSSDPQNQEKAYLVSTLLRAAHDNIWIAPLLVHKNKAEYAKRLEQMQKNLYEARKKAQEKSKKYQTSHLGKKETHIAGTQQATSKYIRLLMKENFAEGI